jgi:ligand-binding sensor domain-containing protein
MRTIWLHIMLLLIAGPAITQTLPVLRFSHITERDGLSNNFVHSIVQDGDGLIWIATENGLNRFDGYGFKSFYANAGDTQSVQNNRIQQLIADNKGRLWGSTNEGIFCFNIAAQRSFAWPLNPADNQNLVGILRPYHVFLDSNQLPWASTYSWVVRDTAGRLWATRGNIIYNLDPDTRNINHTWEGPSRLVIRDIRFDSYNRCWISTWGNGIYLVDLRGNRWTPFSPSDIRPVVYGGAEWRLEGQPWMVFACSYPCLVLVNEKDLSSYTIPFDSTTMAFHGPPFVDRQNILWLSTTDGVYYSSSSNNLFKVIDIPVLPSEVHKPVYAYVYCIKEDSTGYWLSKRYYGGIFWYDKHWRLIRTWPGAEVLPAGRFGARAAMGEAFDFERVGNQLFVSTESGISILDLSNFHWTIVPPPMPGPNLRLRNIVIRDPRSWWIRSYNQGVYVFDPIARKFTHHYTNPDTTADKQPWIIHYLAQDKYHNIFASTSSGLFRYAPEIDAFKPVRFKGNINPGRSLFGLTADSSGLLLVGGENGLFVYDPQTGAIQRTFKEDNKIGLVSRICIDDRQNVWFSSISGYWCWLRKPDKVVHFDYGLGLPPTDDGSMYKTFDGCVYAGGKDAITRFYPGRLITYQSTARTKIIDALVGDSVASFTTNTDGHRQLMLKPDRNSFSVDFDVVNYDLISSNQYFYKLTPGDPRWHQSESGHLTFYNLQPGSYTLEVRGASKLTGSYTNTDSLDITVNPWWYQSTWFRIGSLLLLCGLAWYLVRHRIRAVRKDAAFRQKMSDMEMTALRAQMNPHFIFNSLNSIENFIMQNEKRLASDYLNKFASLVRMILENSRTQAVPLVQDMEAMQLYVDLERLRFENKFGYFTEIDEVLLKGDYRVAPLLIQPFVENAIVHGLAPSDKPGLYLKITVRLRNDFIHYTIEDNGIGRTESMAYARKYRPGHKSLGIGISRERIDLINRKHGTAGTLDIIDLYDDRQPAGTRVILTININ